MGAIKEYTPTYESGMRVIVPEKITECTACPKYKGCMTDFVCHTASKDDGISILDSGRLLSADKAIRKTAKELKSESRNAAGELEEKVYYICNDCKNIWEWSEKVYEFVKRVRI